VYRKVETCPTYKAAAIESGARILLDVLRLSVATIRTVMTNKPVAKASRKMARAIPTPGAISVRIDR